MLPAAGCNLLFGIHDGELTSSSASSGTGGCGVYDGDGMVTATNTGSANLATVTFYASGSVSGAYQPPRDTTEINIGSGPAGATCDLGLRVTLSGHVMAGTTYTLASEATFNSPAFHMGAHAFVELAADLTCTPPAPKEWQSLDSAAGTVRVTSVTATSVALSFTGVEITGVTNAMGSGTGKLVLDGAVHSDCFGF